MAAKPRLFAYPPRRLRAPEAARYVGLSETAFLALALPPIRIGGTVGWLREDLDAYLDGLRPVDAPPPPGEASPPPETFDGPAALAAALAALPTPRGARRPRPPG